MKLISLNAWVGRAGKENLLDFFKKHNEVDIFCLQEIWEGGAHRLDYYQKGWAKPELKIINTLLTDISKVLPNYKAFFYPAYEDFFGLAIFIKKDINIIEEGDIFVHRTKQDAFDREDANHARNLQYITIETASGVRTIANFHGLWNGQGKSDTQERLLQSDNIANFLKNIPHPHVLCGDFNLLPETQSLKKFEAMGLKNLIKEFGITSTRSSHYEKPIKFADYTFMSPEIKINEFKVLPDEVSDHLAMYLDFE